MSESEIGVSSGVNKVGRAQSVLVIVFSEEITSSPRTFVIFLGDAVLHSGQGRFADYYLNNLRNTARVNVTTEDFDLFQIIDSALCLCILATLRA